MTKKEKAAFEALLTEAALYRTQRVLPDVDVPGHYSEGLSTGWLFVGEQSDRPRIDVACSSSVHHAFGRTDKTTSQNSRKLYSTKLNALKALRYMVELDCCKRLRGVDRMIEEAS